MNNKPPQVTGKVINIKIPYKYTPRWYQGDFFDCLGNGYRRGVAVCHRRWGKDKTAWNLTIKEAFSRVGSYYYFLPTLKQGRKIIWEGMDKTGFRFLHHIPRVLMDGDPNNTDMRIKLQNKSIIQVVGTDNPDAVRGTNPLGVVFSEFSWHDPIVWEIVEPILLENGGWALFLFTPQGKNHAYKLAMNADISEDWFYVLSTVDDTDEISKKQIDKSNMSESMKQQEFWCSFDASMRGAYYSSEVAAVRATKRITRVPIEPNLPVLTAWDLGVSGEGACTIWFFQKLGREIHVIDCYSNHGVGHDHYIDYLKQWRTKHNAIYDKHLLPHDGRNRIFAAGCKSTVMLMNEAGLEAESINRPIKKGIGIQAVRQMFPRCWFDRVKTGVGIKSGFEALSQYRTKGDPENETDDSATASEPLHNWCSHYADAFQTMALYEQRFNVKVQPKQDPIISGIDVDFKLISEGNNKDTKQTSWMRN